MAPAPQPTNVLILANIPEGVSEQQMIASAGRPTEVLQMTYRGADLEGLGWAFVAFATPDLAKAARDRLHMKQLPGASGIPFVLEAVLGEGLYGNVRRFDDHDSPWKEARSPKGEIYYYHAVTKQTSWTKPLPAFPPVPPPPGVGRPGFPMPQPPPHLLGVTPPPPAAPPPPGVSTAALAAQAAVQAAQATAGAANSQAVSSGKQGPVGSNLFVYHIPNSWDDNILRQHFEHFGSILSCRIQKDTEGRARGFGFISYDSPEAAQAAIAGMHGFPVEGKWLKVQLKKGDEQQLNPESGTGVPPPPPPGAPNFSSARPPAPPRAAPF